MRWFRSRRSWVGCLALFALLLQLGLSFGHHHGLAVGHPHAVQAGVPAGDGNDPAAPQHRGRDDYCAICAVLAQLGGAQIAVGPALPHPIALSSAALSLPAEIARGETHRFAFRSRAPPLS